MSRVMYVTAVDVQQVDLPHCLTGWGYEIALVELHYSPLWHNISGQLGNNLFSIGGKAHVIPAGYYNVCSLDKILKRNSVSVELHGPTGRLWVTTGDKPVTFDNGLAEVLGFDVVALEPNQTTPAKRPHRLAVHRELFVHLKELSATGNIVNGRPSTLLRAVPVGNEACASGRTWTPAHLEYKKLRSGVVSQLSIEVLGADGIALPLDYVRMTFKIEGDGL